MQAYALRPSCAGKQMIEDATEIKDEWRNAVALAATAAMILAGSAYVSASRASKPSHFNERQLHRTC